MPTYPPREPSWDDIQKLAPVDHHAPECTRAQEPVVMDPQPPGVMGPAYQQCPECSMISQVVGEEEEPVAPERVMPSMIPTSMHHSCTVAPVPMDPQPKGSAWLVYECPDCHVIATSPNSSHGSGPSVAAPSRPLAPTPGGWKGFYRYGQTLSGAERYRAW